VLIDWFTVVAQIVNFLILVALLRRFLYGPIIKVMNEREQKIAFQVEEARQKKLEVEHDAETLRQKIDEVEQTRQQMFEQAQADLEKWRQEKIGETRAEVDEVRKRWRQSIQQEQEALLSQLRQRTADQVLVIARRALSDLANVDLENQIAASFVEQIQGLEDSVLDELNHALNKSSREIAVSSSFELPPEVRQKIQDVIDRQIGDDCAVHYETTPTKAPGIELKVSGYKVAWSIEAYLDNLEETISQIFHTHTADVQ
jgi:F-type H+-transporting ATPase subunit b